MCPWLMGTYSYGWRGPSTDQPGAENLSSAGLLLPLFGWLATALFTGLGCYAKKSGWGQHLGLDTSLDIHWLAMRTGMRWSSLLFERRNSVSFSFGFPDAIVLQLWENDILAFKE
uniref:Uncharacterized protein n=1 Tax=Sphaerodactylus townsendi TaxID=933632 RepID=A0ACB8FGN0_9SAUR